MVVAPLASLGPAWLMSGLAVGLLAGKEAGGRAEKEAT